MAITSAITGVVGFALIFTILAFVGLILGILSLVLGIISVGKISREGGTGMGFGITGIVAGGAIILTILVVATIFTAWVLGA